MPRRYLKIVGKEQKRVGDEWIFNVRGEINGETHLFELTCMNHELDQERINKINSQFRASLQYLKHHGGWPDSSASEEDMKAAMNKWSSTNTGIGIKVGEDPIPEFIPFTL